MLPDMVRNSISTKQFNKILSYVEINMELKTMVTPDRNILLTNVRFD